MIVKRNPRAGHGYFALQDVAAAFLMLGLGILGFPIAIPMLYGAELLGIRPTGEIFTICYVLGCVFGIYLNYCAICWLDRKISAAWRKWRQK